MTPKTMLKLAPALCLATAACAVDSPSDTTADTTPGTVSEELIEQLAQRYRVLRPDTAPEPQPSSNARPHMIPQRVRAALSPRVLQQVTGEATFYANTFEGRRTASGIPFRQHQLVAAHRAYPFGTLLRVTNLRNGSSVNVRVVDRGPFGALAATRRTIIDLSRRAAAELGYVQAGRTPVRVEVLEWGPGLPLA